MNTTGVPGPPPRGVRPREADRPPVLTAGLMVVAVGAPILFGIACFFIMLMVWRRMDRRQIRDRLPEVAPKQVIVPMPRCVKIPVVILEPDSTYDVAYPYATRADAAGRYAGGGFSVLTVSEPGGPLWRAQSMTPSDASCTPRLRTISSGGIGAAGPGGGLGAAYNFSPAGSNLAGSPELQAYSTSGTPIEFALPPLPPGEFLYTPTGPDSASPAAGGAATPLGKRHSRQGSADVSKPRKKEQRQRLQQQQVEQQQQQAEQEVQGGAEGEAPAADAAPGQQAGSESPEGRPARTRSSGSGFFSWLNRCSAEEQP